ncbi:hypothetical protein SAMN04487846_3591 [Microbacterium sp. cf046]|uniref:hypothetical protein n=1 Tax=Microbacterium sp. cf046 TaxID=1761803 RepID=UPI0008F3D9D7|nr:hypothetical protein [Microbacterium sp. cf046]SFS17539.1 hypothetical protein SAMN04487846_3591 [Microbacterium sp. cf046]
MDSLSFEEGAELDPLSAVGLNLSFDSDAPWTPKVDAGEGETIFVNAEGTCTAQYWQEVFEATADDDETASDEFLATLSGATEEEMEEFASTGHFALTTGVDGEPADGDVQNRILLWTTDEDAVLLAARVFANLDYKASQMSNAYSMELLCSTGTVPEDVVDSLDEVASIIVTEPGD